MTKYKGKRFWVRSVISAASLLYFKQYIVICQIRIVQKNK